MIQEMSNARAVREVSLTALWEPVEGLMAADVGDLLYELRQDYPKTTEAPAMPPWTNSEPSSCKLASNETPPCSWWMTNESGNSLVRFQFDRITYSWRHASSGNAYPGYANTRAGLTHLVNVLGQWLSNKRVLPAGLAEEVREVQVDYVNQVDMAPTDLLRGIATGWQELSREPSRVAFSLYEAILPLNIGQPERDETTVNIESDGLAGSTLTVTTATQGEGNAGYLTHLDRAQEYCQEAFLSIMPEQLLLKWGLVDDSSR